MSEVKDGVKTAEFVRELSDGWSGTAKLYRMTPPMPYGWEPEGDKPQRTTEYVVSSAVVAMFSGPETYLFPADKDGEVIDWGELEGSFKGGLDCEKAVENAGYSLAAREEGGGEDE